MDGWAAEQVMDGPQRGAVRADVPGVGIVVIGRNEEARLESCLDSLPREGNPLVYVDSGSVDGSAGIARAKGVKVIELDASRPFTAARSRNAGREWLASQGFRGKYVQFVDGDCALHREWLAEAVGFLEDHEDVTVVAGQLRERDPRASLYHRLLDMEWDVPAGEVDACGGIALMRLREFDAVGGFAPGLAAGEEGELCHRLRQRNGKIVRLAVPMATHDAGPLGFKSWWRRRIRYGRASTETRQFEGLDAARPRRRAAARALAWGALFPSGCLVAAGCLWVWQRPSTALLPIGVLLAGWLALFFRILLRGSSTARSGGSATLMAAFTVLGKVPEAIGVVNHITSSWSRRRT
jgi:GT2 family glycosyltransferase